MKTISLPLVVFSAFSSVSMAAPGSISLVTLKMTESFTAPGTVLKDDTGRPVQPSTPAYENIWSTTTQDSQEFVSKILAFKLSNKEFLELLVDQGVIASITGWSVKATYDEFADGPNLFITKDGVAPIFIGDFFEFLAGADVFAQKSNETIRYNSLGDETGYSISDAFKSKSDLTLNFATNEAEPLAMTLHGIWNFSSALKFLGTGEDRVVLYVPGACSLTGISGTLLDPEEVVNDEDGFYFGSLIEGSWTFAAATPVADVPEP